VTRLAACLLAAAAFLFVAPGARAQAPVARLTGDVVPLAYDLAIAPDVARSASAGSETIDVQVRRPLDAIALNALKIGVTRATIDGRAARVETFPAVEQIVLRTGARLGAGPHRIELAFTSAVHGAGDPRGLYAIGNAYVVTRFEPSTARSMFPCFDEPEFRARFTLHVRAPAAWTVISNMPLRARRPAGAGLTDNDFAPTPPMPAYLLTLDGGVFAHADAVAGTTPIRVFIRPGEEAHARVMAARAQRIVPFYERFFGVPFPLPKLDLVVAPGVLGSALEGWGAITFYAEGDAFGQQYGGGERGDRYAAEVIAHEIAHQWAGDLVTMRWWSDTFVAEAVAQFSQRQAVRALFPELGSWRDDDRAVADVMRGGVRKGSRPVVHVIATDLDAEDFGAFDQATYDKGASVIEGWREAAGDEQFHAALHEYLTRFAYGSATFDDFWGALGGAPGVAYGSSWLLQRGYPVVDVRTACEAGRTTVTLAQTPFVTDPQVEPEFRAQRWVVPVTLRSGANVRRVVLADAGHVETIPGCEPLVVNPGVRPYYLVRYDAPRYRELAGEVTGMGERERGIVYRDATSLHAADELADTAYVRLLAAAAEPMDVDVWEGVAREYARLDDLVRGAPEARVLYAMEVRVLFPYADRYARLARARAPSRIGDDAAAALVLVGDPAVGASFKPDFLTLQAPAAAIANPRAAWTTPALAAAVATAADVDRVEASLRAHTPAGPIISSTQALAGEVRFLTHVGDEKLARRVLADAMQDRALSQNAPLDFLFQLGERHPAVALEYLRAHAAALAATLPPAQRAATFADGVATLLWPAAEPADMERFLRDALPADSEAVQNAVTTIQRRWEQRRALRAALRALQTTAAASACATAVSC